ncbi:MAG: hypothetical protein ACK5QC_01920 [Bacteroidota bacterium]|jgi:hypothetical protein
MKETILKIIYKFYPKEIDSNVESYSSSLEQRHLKSAIKSATANISKWNNFLSNLKIETNNTYEINDWTQFFNNDACYTCRLSYSSIDNELIDLVINISIISDYYSIYVSKIKKIDNTFSIPIISFDTSNINSDLINTIRNSLFLFFPNYKNFPSNLAFEIVDNVSIGNKNIGEANFFDCIFTTHIW